MNSRKIRVVLSTGQGRLHLITAAKSIAAAGVDLSVITSWVPRNHRGLLVRLCSRMVGRDLSFGMKNRIINTPGVEVHAMAFAEFLFQGIRLVDTRVFGGRFGSWVVEFGWKVYGWMSRRYLGRGALVFHCRSGAGQGGAIAKAKRMGMKVVVDHSIAHPAFMEKILKGEYVRNGARFAMGADSLFWRHVLKDCEDADVVLVNSFFVRDTFIEQGYAPEKVKVVYLGEREDFFGLRKPKGGQCGKLKLLFTGGFGFRKGGEYILRALQILKDRGVDFKMDCVGSYQNAQRMIDQYPGLPVCFHGPKPQDELKSFLANGDIYVFPSLAEGCAQSGMEAMAAGMCVVGTRESGFPITDGENGYIVPSKDAKAIADRIEWLSKNRTEIDRVGASAAKMIAANYTWEKYGEKVRRIYEELLAEYP